MDSLCGMLSRGVQHKDLHYQECTPSEGPARKLCLRCAAARRNKQKWAAQQLASVLQQVRAPQVRNPLMLLAQGSQGGEPEK